MVLLVLGNPLYSPISENTWGFPKIPGTILVVEHLGVYIGASLCRETDFYAPNKKGFEKQVKWSGAITVTEQLNPLHFFT